MVALARAISSSEPQGTRPGKPQRRQCLPVQSDAYQRRLLQHQVPLPALRTATSPGSRPGCPRRQHKAEAAPAAVDAIQAYFGFPGDRETPADGDGGTTTGLTVRLTSNLQQGGRSRSEHSAHAAHPAGPVPRQATDEQLASTAYLHSINLCKLRV